MRSFIKSNVYLYMLKFNVIGNIIDWFLGRIKGSVIAFSYKLRNF